VTQLARLAGRGVVEIGGADRVAFLQGLVSNDVTEARPGRAVWAALLTPQGKWVGDFFVHAAGDALLLDCEQAQVTAMMQRLSRFRLRSKVTVHPREDLSVYAAWDGKPPPVAVAAPDPRLPQAGWRILASTALPETANFEAWDRHRLELGLPDGSRDLEPEKTILLEAGFDELNGVSWAKGCYMGQELTARTRYRGLIKRRLVPVRIEGPLPQSGTPVFRNGSEVGTMRSGRDELGLAVLRLDALSHTLSCGEAHLRPYIPSWMRLPEPAR
jgi:tRNA-modifying protein YgfZ